MPPPPLPYPRPPSSLGWEMGGGGRGGGGVEGGGGRWESREKSRWEEEAMVRYTQKLALGIICQDISHANIVVCLTEKSQREGFAGGREALYLALLRPPRPRPRLREARWQPFDGDQLQLAASVAGNAAGDGTAVRAAPDGGCCVAHGGAVRVYNWVMEERRRPARASSAREMAGANRPRLGVYAKAFARGNSTSAKAPSEQNSSARVIMHILARIHESASALDQELAVIIPGVIMQMSGILAAARQSHDDSRDDHRQLLIWMMRKKKKMAKE
uniref:At2g24240-like C-terminal beta-propeller domain-containing protein n=1 Tax=Oryza glumipatula TaxID=40148 RepID=A0A0D9YQI8_9ORYZ